MPTNRVPRILYLQYTNPAGYPPLEHSSRILADAGWDVLFLGTGAFGASALRFPEHPRIQVKQRPFCQPGWRQKLHYFGFVLSSLAWTLRWGPGWVYASDVLASPIALLLSWLPGLRIIYHEHDAPETEVASGFQRLVLWTRTKCARRAAVCVIPNEERAKAFRQQTRSMGVQCVWNCPSKDEVGPERKGPRSDFWLLYHGSVVPARLPLTVLDALAMLPESVKLRVLGYETTGHKGYMDRLKARARELGIEDRVACIGSVPTRAELLDWCRRSDVGLALMPLSSRDPNEQTMAGASNKAFDYMACGLPVIVTDMEPWTSLFVQPGYGFGCRPESAQTIASAIQRLLFDSELTRRMGEAGRRRIAEEWNYETLFRPVLRVLTGSA